MNTTDRNRVWMQVRGDQSPQRYLHDIEQDTLRIQEQSSKREQKRRTLLIGVLLVLLLASSISSVVGFLMYHTYDARYQMDLSLAHAGTQHLQKAESLLATWSQRLLDTQNTNQAKIEFASAFKNFTSLNTDLIALPGLLKQVPTYGARLDSALRLVPLAISLSRAGMTGCSILNTLVTGLHDPLTPQGHGITHSDLSVVSQDLKELQSELVLATQQVNQLQPVDMQFDSRLPKLVSTFHKDLAMIQGWINTILQLLPVAPTLLGIGTPTNYLIEILDATELRPGGGFIGNYGIATLSGGRLSAAHITDVDLLDRPFEFAGHVISYPPAYRWFDLAPGSWSLRDSNLDADFPTAAHYAEQTYMQEGGKVPVQGVIAITPELIKNALVITGPINMLPEYNETVTSQNLIDRIHFHQLGNAGEGSEHIPSPDGHSSLRKRFTELLAEHFLARVRQLPSSDLSKFLLLMTNAVRSKDLQIYFNSSIAENWLRSFHLDAAIQSPAGDGLFVVDANISGNKANSFINTTMDDQVTINSKGDVVHHTTLHYSWTIAGLIYGSSVYRDFVRVYVPSGSTLLAQDGWQPRGTSNAFNRAVWMGFFTFSYRQTRTISLVWKVPAASLKIQSGWSYHYLIQRQAGTLWKMNVQISLPSCADITSRLGGLMSDGKQKALLTQPLTEDTNLGVDYACR